LSPSLQGENSKWHGYLQSLPKDFDLPVIWKTWHGFKPGRYLSDKEKDDIWGACAWLSGTEVDRALEELDGDGRTHFVSDTFLTGSLTHCSPGQQDRLERFYERVAEPTLLRHGNFPAQTKIEFDGFVKAFCLVSSRAFMVDAFHGLAMVPIADACVPPRFTQLHPFNGSPC